MRAEFKQKRDRLLHFNRRLYIYPTIIIYPSYLNTIIYITVSLSIFHENCVPHGRYFVMCIPPFFNINYSQNLLYSLNLSPIYTQKSADKS